jgi:hypothetical protein
MKTLSIGLCAMSLAAQTAFSPPLIGVFTDTRQQMRRVYGIAGNFIVGGAERRNILAAAFSGRSGMIKTANEVLVLDERGQVVWSMAAPAGPALFAFNSDGSPALTYFPATRQLRTAELPVPLDPFEGEILALGIASGEAKLAFRRDGELWMAHLDVDSGHLAAVEKLASQASGPVLLLPDPVVAEGKELRIGLDRRLRFPAAIQTMQQIGDGWIAISLADGTFRIVRLAEDGAQIYSLPAVEVVE